MNGRLPWLALALLAAAGCASEVPAPQPAPEVAPTVSPLGPRPQTLSLAEIDPCALLTAAQVSALNVHAGQPGEDNDGLGSRDCIWSTSPDTPDIAWIARATLRRGAEWYRASVTGADVVQVAGYPAVQTVSNVGDPDTQCVLAVDVAQGQSLWVQFDNMDKDYPGMNHQRACQLARQAAESMVTNLRELAR